MQILPQNYLPKISANVIPHLFFGRQNRHFQGFPPPEFFASQINVKLPHFHARWQPC
jgi:hypothetical protein